MTVKAFVSRDYISNKTSYSTNNPEKRSAQKYYKNSALSSQEYILSKTILNICKL